MKLTVGEAAKLLETTESVVYRWIKQGGIPCHRVNDSYRFHKAELLEWATSRGMSISAEAFPASRRSIEIPGSGFLVALRRGGVHHDVEGNDRESVLRAIVRRMPLREETDREMLFEVLLAREALGSTGVGEGIAIPHVRSPVVLPANQPAMSLCFLAHPIDFSAIDERPVHTFFSLVMLTIRSHLFMLSRLSLSLQDARFKQAVLARASADVIFAEAARVELSTLPAADEAH